ncbi:hypothetical protein LINPERPRIM_LOCUS22126 [Linum perenne]
MPCLSMSWVMKLPLTRLILISCSNLGGKVRCLCQK